MEISIKKEPLEEEPSNSQPCALSEAVKMEKDSETHLSPESAEAMSSGKQTSEHSPHITPPIATERVTEIGGERDEFRGDTELLNEDECSRESGRKAGENAQGTEFGGEIGRESAQGNSCNDARRSKSSVVAKETGMKRKSTARLLEAMQSSFPNDVGARSTSNDVTLTRDVIERSTSQQNFVKQLEMFVASVDDPRHASLANHSRAPPHHATGLSISSKVKDVTLSGSYMSTNRRRNYGGATAMGASYPYLLPLLAMPSPRAPLPSEQPIDLSMKKSKKEDKQRFPEAASRPLPLVRVDYIRPVGPADGPGSSLASLEEKFGERSSILNEIGVRSISLSDRFGFACGGSFYDSSALLLRNAAGSRGMGIPAQACFPAFSTDRVASRRDAGGRFSEEYPRGGSIPRSDTTRSTDCLSKLGRPYESQFGASPFLLNNLGTSANTPTRDAVNAFQTPSWGLDAWLRASAAQADTGGPPPPPPSLCCMECRSMFHSLKELTVHMIQAEHYMNLIGARGFVQRPVSRESSGTSSSGGASLRDTDDEERSHRTNDEEALRRRSREFSRGGGLNAHSTGIPVPATFRADPPVLSSHSAPRYQSDKTEALARKRQGGSGRSVSRNEAKRRRADGRDDVDESVPKVSSTAASDRTKSDASIDSPLSRMSSSSSDTYDYPRPKLAKISKNHPNGSDVGPKTQKENSRRCYDFLSSHSAARGPLPMPSFIERSLSERAKFEARQNFDRASLAERFSQLPWGGLTNAMIAQASLNDVRLRKTSPSPIPHKHNNSRTEPGRINKANSCQFVPTAQSCNDGRSKAYSTAKEKSFPNESKDPTTLHSEPTLTSSTSPHVASPERLCSIQSKYIQPSESPTSSDVGTFSALASLQSLVYGGGATSSRDGGVQRSLGRWASGITSTSREHASVLPMKTKRSTKEQMPSVNSHAEGKEYDDIREKGKDEANRTSFTVESANSGNYPGQHQLVKFDAAAQSYPASHRPLTSSSHFSPAEKTTNLSAMKISPVTARNEGTDAEVNHRKKYRKTPDDESSSQPDKNFTSHNAPLTTLQDNSVGIQFTEASDNCRSTSRANKDGNLNVVLRSPTAQQCQKSPEMPILSSSRSPSPSSCARHTVASPVPREIHELSPIPPVISPVNSERSQFRFAAPQQSFTSLNASGAESADKETCILPTEMKETKKNSVSPTESSSAFCERERVFIAGDSEKNKSTNNEEESLTTAGGRARPSHSREASELDQFSRRISPIAKTSTFHNSIEATVTSPFVENNQSLRKFYATGFIPVATNFSDSQNSKRLQFDSRAFVTDAPPNEVFPCRACKMEFHSNAELRQHGKFCGLVVLGAANTRPVLGMPQRFSQDQRDEFAVAREAYSRRDSDDVTRDSRLPLIGGPCAPRDVMNTDRFSKYYRLARELSGKTT